MSSSSLSSPFPHSRFSSVPHTRVLRSQFVNPTPGFRVIDDAYVIDAADVGSYISEQQPPRSHVDAHFRIVRSRFLNPTPGFGLIDGADISGHGIKTQSIERGDQRDEECSICFENYRKHKRAFKTECNHVFHQHCISKWLLNNNSCPLCRKRVY